jgi:hypothetical protein
MGDYSADYLLRVRGWLDSLRFSIVVGVTKITANVSVG